jgi:putative transcriptional regulator
MIDLLAMKKKRQRGVFDGQFLIAMPSLVESTFSKTVIFVCAHSDDGAMGFIINRAQTLSFLSILQHLKLVGEDSRYILPPAAGTMPIYAGGPVENGRGFVLHSDDFVSESSMPVTEDIYLTATLDVVKAIAAGSGPRKAAMMLGYAGWSAGQLENEMAQNAWLHCRASEDLIFDPMLDDKYERAMATMGVSPAMLSTEIGHA